MSPGEPGRGYIRAVEAAWSKLVGRAVVVSPREFEAVDAWRRRGVPLAVVLEALANAAKRRSGRIPRSLTALTPAIEEAFAVVAEGKSPTGVAEPVPVRAEARRAWEAALARCVEDAPLRALLNRLLAEESKGAAAGTIDAALDEALPRAVPPEQLAQALEETRNSLAGFRSRMSEAEFASTLSRALAERLRLTLALPRLALTR